MKGLVTSGQQTGRSLQGADYFDYLPGEALYVSGSRLAYVKVRERLQNRAALLVYDKQNKGNFAPVKEPTTYGQFLVSAPDRSFSPR